MKGKTEYLIDSDILIEHLSHTDVSTESVLEKAVKKGNCFTTALNASELYFGAESNSEKEIIDKLLDSLTGVLGFHPRYSFTIYELRGRAESLRDAMFLSVALNNRLPILTMQKERYKNTGATIILPENI